MTTNESWRARVARTAQAVQQATAAGDFEKATALINDGFATIEREGSERDAVFIALLLAAADCADAGGSPEHAEPLYNRAAWVCQELDPEARDTEDLGALRARAFLGMARTDADQGRIERAKERYAYCLRIMPQLTPAPPAELVEAVRNELANLGRAGPPRTHRESNSARFFRRRLEQVATVPKPAPAVSLLLALLACSSPGGVADSATDAGIREDGSPTTPRDSGPVDSGWVDTGDDVSPSDDAGVDFDCTAGGPTRVRFVEGIHALALAATTQGLFLAGPGSEGQTVVAYETDDTLRWAQSVASDMSGFVALAAMPDGGVVLADRAESELRVVRLGIDGSLQWGRVIHGDWAFTRLSVVDVDPTSGDLWLAGTRGVFPVVAKIRADGSLASIVMFLTRSRQASAIESLPDGGAIVAIDRFTDPPIRLGGAIARDGWIIRLSARGEIRWQRSLRAPGGEMQRVQSIAVGGRVVRVAGIAYLSTSLHHDAWVADIGLDDGLLRSAARMGPAGEVFATHGPRMIARLYPHTWVGSALGGLPELAIPSYTRAGTFAPNGDAIFSGSRIDRGYFPAGWETPLGDLIVTIPAAGAPPCANGLNITSDPVRPSSIILQDTETDVPVLASPSLSFASWTPSVTPFPLGYHPWCARDVECGLEVTE